MKRFFDLTFRPFFVLTGIGNEIGRSRCVLAAVDSRECPEARFHPGLHHLCAALGNHGWADGCIHDRGRFSGGLANSDSHL